MCNNLLSYKKCFMKIFNYWHSKVMRIDGIVEAMMEKIVRMKKLRMFNKNIFKIFRKGKTNLLCLFLKMMHICMLNMIYSCALQIFSYRRVEFKKKCFSFKNMLFVNQWYSQQNFYKIKCVRKLITYNILMIIETCINIFK